MKEDHKLALFMQDTKTKSKWNRALNVTATAIKLLKESTRENLSCLLGEDVLARHQKHNPQNKILINWTS